MAGEDTREAFVKGRRIDRYEIREHIGQGGMGAVYRAVDTKLGRTVALKFVVARRQGDRLSDEIRERFTREALAASRVDHRNVVQVLDFGFVDDDTPYMVMEYLRGRSLADILKSAKEPLALDYVADVMLGVCAALRACHHVGIIHRDLKPANIFLCDTDTGWDVKVLDFGISKAPASELTQEGQIVGTPQYLSPEQIEGTVGPEADQYALGVLLYVCLTQRLPYAGYQSVRLLRAISEGQFDPPRALRPELPEALEAILLRAMRLQAKDRFESIHALGQKLWDFASPRGQAQWRTFYFHTPTSQAAKAATLVDPTDVLDQAPEERDAGPTAAAADAAGTTDEPRPDATSSFDSRSALAKTAALGPPRADPAGVTKTAAASGGGEAAGQSQSDIAGESALSDAGRAGHARRSARFRLAALVVGFACIGVAVLLRASRSGPRPARPIAASAAAPAPPAVPAPVPAAASPPAPAATPLEAVPTAGPASAPAPVRREPAKRAEKAPAAEHSRKKHATHLRRAPNIDQNGIGIPTD